MNNEKNKLNRSMEIILKILYNQFNKKMGKKNLEILRSLSDRNIRLSDSTIYKSLRDLEIFFWLC